MNNPKLEEMRASIETEIKGVEDKLTTLRTQKAELAEQIKAVVSEQAELRSALARLTPRQRKSRASEPAQVETTTQP